MAVSEHSKTQIAIKWRCFCDNRQSVFHCSGKPHKPSCYSKYIKDRSAYLKDIITPRIFFDTHIDTLYIKDRTLVCLTCHVYMLI